MRWSPLAYEPDRRGAGGSGEGVWAATLRLYVGGWRWGEIQRRRGVQGRVAVGGHTRKPVQLFGSGVRPERRVRPPLRVG